MKPGNALRCAHFAVLALISTAAPANTIALIDDFSIARNGSTWFHDAFADGAAPPSLPAGAGGDAAPYAVNGGAFPPGSESAGKLSMDTAFGVAVFNPAGVAFVQTTVQLNSDVTPGNTTLGLKKNFDFTVRGLFDLTAPTAFQDGYGIRLRDRSSGAGGDDQLLLDVFRTASGVSFALFDQNFVAGTTVSLFAPVDFSLGDQIELVLDHVAGSDIVTASVQYWNLGAPTGSVVTLGTGVHMFQGEDYVTAAFDVFERRVIPEPASTALVGLGVAGLGFGRRRKPARV